MSAEVRFCLFFGAVFTLVYFIHNIRKNRMQIDYAIFWALFSAALVLLSIFPGAATIAAGLFRIASPANLVFLVIVFALILKLFTTTLKISKLNQQMTELTQYIALKEAAMHEASQNGETDKQK